MAFFVPRWSRFREKKPDGPVEIDWSNPLSDALCVAIVNGENLVSQANISQTPFGQAVQSSTGINNFDGKAYVDVGVSDTSVFIDRYYLATPVWNASGTDYRDTNSTWPNDLGVQILSAQQYGYFRLRCRDDGLANREISHDVISGNIGAGDRIAGTYTISAGNSVNAYDGTGLLGTTDWSAYTFDPAASGSALVGTTNTTDDTDTNVIFLYRWKKELSAGAVEAIQQFPAQIVKPRRQYIVFGASGATELSINDSTHSHAADNVVLQDIGLLVNDALHSHIADNVVLQDIGLLVNDSAHSHTADNVDLDVSELLDIQDATHALQSDNLTLQDVGLLIAESSHALQSDNIQLMDIGLLVQGSNHAHIADNVILDINEFLDIQDATHTLQSDNIVLQDIGLLIQDSAHGLQSENIELSQHYTLVANDSLHALTSDNLTLSTGVACTATSIHQVNLGGGDGSPIVYLWEVTQITGNPPTITAGQGTSTVTVETTDIINTSFYLKITATDDSGPTESTIIVDHLRA